MWVGPSPYPPGTLAHATINTSFNMRREPTVDDARGALASARSIGLDFVTFDDRVVDLTDRRSAQPGE